MVRLVYKIRIIENNENNDISGRLGGVRIDKIMGSTR